MITTSSMISCDYDQTATSRGWSICYNCYSYDIDYIETCFNKHRYDNDVFKFEHKYPTTKQPFIKRKRRNRLIGKREKRIGLKR